MSLEGAFNVLNGIGNYMSAGKISKIKKKTASQQHEYNKKEIERSFQDNFMNTMNQYVGARSELISEATKTAADLRTQLSMDNGADTEMNSYRTDSFNKLDAEFMDNMTSLITEQVYQVKELAYDKEAQKFESGMMYSNALNQIEMVKIQAEKDAIAQVVKGSSQLADSYTGKPSASSVESSKAELGSYNAGIQNFGYSSYKPKTTLQTTFKPDPRLMEGY